MQHEKHRRRKSHEVSHHARLLMLLCAGQLLSCCHVVLHMWASCCVCLLSCLPGHPCYGLHVRIPPICMHPLHTSTQPGTSVRSRQLNRSLGTQWFRDASTLVSLGLWPLVPFQSHGHLAWMVRRRGRQSFHYKWVHACIHAVHGSPAGSR